MYLQIYYIRKGLKAVLESDKIVISKNGVFVGKGYSCDGMFKLSINNNISVSIYIVEQSFSLWHGRLEHANYKTLQYMSKHSMITCQDEINNKCEVCIQAKMPRKSFPSVQRNYEILDLVYFDICELNGMLTSGGNRYFITFIDNFSRYSCVFDEIERLSFWDVHMLQITGKKPKRKENKNN